MNQVIQAFADARPVLWQPIAILIGSALGVAICLSAAWLLDKLRG